MNKDVCKICYEERGMRWAYLNDCCWEMDWVHCPAIGTGAKITLPVPARCKYTLEHVTMGQNGKEIQAE